MEAQRYSRQISLDAIGEAGQHKLHSAHVAVVGCGGLGAIAAAYLAGAGVGTLTLIDGDHPHISNLHRQVFFKEETTGLTKAEELAAHIRGLNSDVDLHVISEMLGKENIDKALSSATIVMECTDDILIKYLVNDFCHLHRIPMVYGAIYKYEGMVSFFQNASDADIHLRDLFAEPALEIPSCVEVGVLNTIAGIIGLLQSTEVIKYLTGCGPNLNGELLSYEALENTQRKIKLKKHWTGDLQAIHAASSYQAAVCANEDSVISYEQLIAEAENLRVISVLEMDEHVAIIPSTEHLPYSTFDPNDWKNDGRTSVFYCASGTRAKDVVQRLSLQYPEQSFHYLQKKLTAILSHL